MRTTEKPMTTKKLGLSFYTNDYICNPDVVTLFINAELEIYINEAQRILNKFPKFRGMEIGLESHQFEVENWEDWSGGAIAILKINKDDYFIEMHNGRDSSLICEYTVEAYNELEDHKTVL